jgi:mannose-6-phosphate isomerase class I
MKFSHPDYYASTFCYSSDPNSHSRYDDNHKPEICIPLGSFEALCAFRPYEQICNFCKKHPELATLCGVDGNAENFPELKDLYAKLMRAEAGAVEEQVSDYILLLERKVRILLTDFASVKMIL